MTPQTRKFKLPLLEVTALLKNVPLGISWDVIETKIKSVSTLTKKEKVAFLEHCRGHAQIEVLEQESRGVPTEPLLRHRIHADITRTPQASNYVPERDVPFGKKETFNPDNAPLPVPIPPRERDPVVFKTTPGGRYLAPKAKTTTALAVKKAVKEAAVEKETPPVKVDEYQLARLPARLQKSVKDIMEYLATQPGGVTLTQLGNKVMGYHNLPGADRQRVVAHVKTYCGVAVGKTQIGVRGGSPTVLTHSKFNHAVPTAPAESAKLKGSILSDRGQHVSDDERDDLEEAAVTVIAGHRSPLMTLRKDRIPNRLDHILNMQKNARDGKLDLNPVEGEPVEQTPTTSELPTVSETNKGDTVSIDNTPVTEQPSTSIRDRSIALLQAIEEEEKARVAAKLAPLVEEVRATLELAQATLQHHQIVVTSLMDLSTKLADFTTK